MVYVNSTDIQDIQIAHSMAIDSQNSYGITFVLDRNISVFHWSFAAIFLNLPIYHKYRQSSQMTTYEICKEDQA